MKNKGPRRPPPTPVTPSPDGSAEADESRRTGWNAWIGKPFLEEAWQGQLYVWAWERRTSLSLTSATVPLLLRDALWAEKEGGCSIVLAAPAVVFALRQGLVRAFYGDRSHVRAIAEALVNEPISRGVQGLIPVDPWEADQDEQLVHDFERTKVEMAELEAFLPGQAKTPSQLLAALPTQEELEKLVPTLEEVGPGKFLVRNGWLARVVLGGRDALRPLLDGISRRRSGRSNRHEAALSVWAQAGGFPLLMAPEKLAWARDRVRKRAKGTRQRRTKEA